MYSNVVPFETVLEGIKDETGITNLRNLLPKIRRLIYRAEKDIGFGSTVLLKRIKYTTVDNSIIVTGTGEDAVYKVKLPTDILYMEEVGSCYEGLCSGDYRIQGNYMFLCRPIEEFSFIYYTLLCDGNGNPVVSENHLEAVIAGVSYWLYKPMYRNGKGSRAVFKDLEQFYHDRIGEAIGDDLMPSTQKEWSKIADLFKMSHRDILLFSERDRCFCCVPESKNLMVPENSNQEIVYYWQFNDLTSDIGFAPFIDQNFLDLQNVTAVQTLINGLLINYSNIGRIAFAISNTSENKFRIYDVFDTDITDVVFDTYWNSELNTQIYISKQYYSHGSIFFKLIKQ